MVQITELLDYTAQFLNVRLFRDYCPNGLQVAGQAEVNNVIVGVSASKALIEEAIIRQADTLLVHHGYFWKNEEPVLVGMKRERIRLLLEHNINLIAYHLPLDAHLEVGNNASLGRRLGFEPLYQCADQNLLNVGTCEPQTLGALAQTIEQQLMRAPLVIGQSDRQIRRVAWCTGGAQGYFTEAINQQVDVFITGEISEQMVDMAHESGVAFIAAGHYATERYGVQALAQHWADRFQVSCEFIELTNPV